MQAPLAQCHLEQGSIMSAKTIARTLTAATAWLILAACSSLGGGASGGLKLTGDQEVPPVTTTAAGSGTITIGADGSVGGTVTTTGLDGTAAHIHVGSAGKNGPVIVPMTKTGDGVWSFASGAKLTPEQLKAYEAGDLYVNVHSAANKGGEIRAQLKP
jgi:hypothetical protein